MVSPPAAGPWRDLADLHQRAGADPSLRPVLGAALRDFHGAGWTYRQLGRQLGVSYEWIRLAKLEAADTGSGIVPPDRPASPQVSVIPLLDLDPALKTVLAQRLAAAAGADTGGRTPSGLKPAVADLFAALHAAAAAGWDAHSLARGIGSHPKAVFKFIAQHARTGEGTRPVVAPAPDQKVKALSRARRPSFQPVRVGAADTAELHRLEPGAYGDTADTGALGRYLALMGHWYLLGAGRRELEHATGQHWETLRKRLVRGGYMSGNTRPGRSRAAS